MMRSRPALHADQAGGLLADAPLVQDVRVNDIDFLIYIFRCGVGLAMGAIASCRPPGMPGAGFVLVQAFEGVMT